MYKLIKRNKRLCIVDEADTVVYTPPDFLRFKIRSRSEMQPIVDAFNAKGEYDIVSIIDFQSKF